MNNTKIVSIQIHEDLPRDAHYIKIKKVFVSTAHRKVHPKIYIHKYDIYSGDTKILTLYEQEIRKIEPKTNRAEI